MPKILFTKEKKTIEVEVGTNLRQAALKEGIPLYPGIHRFVNCMGLGSCASCLVSVKKGTDNVSRQGFREWLRILTGPILFFARFGREKELRLACQTRVNGDVEVETDPDLNLYGDRFWG